MNIEPVQLATVVLNPALVALRYCHGMKGSTMALLYNLLLKLDEYYSNPINVLDEVMGKKMHNVWSVMDDFSKAPGGKDFSKMKT